MVKRFSLSFVLAFSFLSFAFPSQPVVYSQNQESVYAGSRKSDKYHRPSRVWAGKINPENLVSFEAKEAAGRVGYVPLRRTLSWRQNAGVAETSPDFNNQKLTSLIFFIQALKYPF